jgi:Carboxypeptidase regulatory-like domain
VTMLRHRSSLRVDSRQPRHSLRLSVRSALVVFLALICAAPSFAANQDKKTDSELRTIHGTALDKDENPIPSSVIYLLNVKTQAVRTYIADDAGNYRFSGLDPNVDYEIHAEHNDLTSSTRTVSSFDSRRDIEVILKLSHKKPAK